ncbi:V-type ATP synthase subunit D [Archaeoglobus veneficus]|uniref:A-type ATP synthase subunit D n=1 Tax=Archaeoglobus veneficus (strain DSM 11195 / SNP6) TaxID=693661 RepID=F2KP32_ARCVS|nr:V-type ATP synthase subunit D [Archaeoglobus veneficus]AEA46340.1 V-type ATP synthase subunit D [Archaeoglobus veneficus SNP6]
MAEIKPTRMELIKLKRRIKMATRGHALLKMKRDGLIMEFREILEEAKDVIGGMVDKFNKANERITLAKAVDGVLAVRSVAISCQCEPEFTIKKKNIMGVVVPVVKREKIRRKVSEREYGVIATTARIDEAVAAYEELVDAILEVAEIETTVKRLIDEIERTKRRVNALEYRVIPTMKEAAKYITFKLEEQDRENIIRLKKIKSKMAEKEAAKKAQEEAAAAAAA